MQATLKKVWNIAIWVAAAGNHWRKVSSMNPGQHSRTAKKMAEPRVLNIRWMSPARLALAPAVMEDMRAVTQEPMFVPKMIYSTSLPPEPMVSPATDMAIITEVVAELDCTSAVSRMPIRNSRKGLSTVSKMLWMASRFIFIASDMRDRPMKTRPRPDRMRPVFFIPSFLQTMDIMMPAKTRTWI